MEEEELFGKDKGLVGLSNQGNTCYMNSALQCLRFTLPLSSFLIQNDIDTDNNLLKSYINIVRKTWEHKTGSLTPKVFKKHLGNSNRMFSGYRQHDSQEFIIHLLDVIHEALKNKGKRNKDKRSIISDLFNGKFRSTVTCLECNYQSTTYEPFTFLSIPLLKSNKSIDLIECFEGFSSEEILDDKNQWTCEKCKKKVQIKKQMDIDIFPNIMAVSLKRFNHRRGKIGTMVNFPMKNLKVGNATYDLYGTVDHYGGMGGGHYTANVLHPHNGWLKMNDSSCRPMNKKDVISKSVYIAFFIRTS